MKDRELPIKGITFLGILNFIILQWFFVRLARTGNVFEKPVTGKLYFHQTGWQWMKHVFPLTGWWNHYLYTKEPRP